MLKFVLFLGALLLSTMTVADRVFDEVLEELRNNTSPRETRQKPRCRRNICFAIDGSDNLSNFQFRVQRAFVRGVVEEISKRNRIGVAAVQYGVSNQVISPLTEDIPAFLEAVASSTFTDASLSFTGAGVVYCQAQLRDESRREPRMVFLGTGQTDVGGSPAERADAFRDDGGEVLAVGIGDKDIENLNDIAGGRENVFRLTSNSIIPVIEEVVESICA